MEAFVCWKENCAMITAADSNHFSLIINGFPNSKFDVEGSDLKARVTKTIQGAEAFFVRPTRTSWRGVVQR